MPSLILSPIPALSDNYIWLLHEEHHGGAALAVDPGEAAPLLQALEVRDLALQTILVTHHHPDHVQGLAELRARWPAVQVIGPDDARIPHLTRRVHDGEHVEALGLRFEVLFVPGHTRSHLAYFAPPSDAADTADAPLLFCGDTLFGAGCGRLFEGTPAQMQASLARLTTLPDRTRVCCTHEYTLANLRFALAVEPDNPALQARQQADSARRAAGQPTLPSSLALECATNPFLRWAHPDVQAAAHRAPQPAASNDPVAVFAALRRWKDQF